MRKSKWLSLLLAGVISLSLVSLAACGENNDDKKNGGNTGTGEAWHNQNLWLKEDALAPTADAEYPVWEEQAEYRSRNISVHDPSIFQDPADGKYYAFGTHFAVASSYDLIEWEQEARDNQYQVLYGEDVGTVTYAGKQWPETLDDTLQVVNPANRGNDTISTTWAPDVEIYNGKYYMYYSITKAFGSSESAIGRVEANSVLGPYTNNKVILSSVGMSGNHVNCIDPELFYDKDGKLWMVYGSHFAGVYIKELYNEGENWGLPKEEGVGKLLWKGADDADNNVVEGPYVFYNATTKYYYLMTTYGALMTTYNMRIARSENPDGPYVDIEGTNVAESSHNGTYHGNCVAGNYKFSWDNGYAALGHNSVIKDAQGRYFVICHTRRQDGSGVTAGHNLLVCQLYFNEEGWPVMSPDGYVGEKMGKIAEDDFVGEYEVVLHSERTQIDFVTSQKMTFAADGNVTSGSETVGTWELKDGFYFTFTLSGQDGQVYKGVVAPNWNTYSNNSAAIAVTAVSNKGLSLWAIKNV